MGNHTAASLDFGEAFMAGERKVHLFRTTSAGCVEISRQPDSPLARLSTNGEWGNAVGLPMSATDLRLLADFLTQYADHMEAHSNA